MRSSLAFVLFLTMLAARARASDPPGDPAMDLLEARALAAESRFDEAVGKLDRAIAGAPDDPYLRLERAKLLYQLGRLDAASEDVMRARLAAPDEEEVLRVQGRVELARSNDDPAALDLARDAWSELRRQDPRDLETLVSLGQLELTAGHSTLAGEILDEASALRPGHPWIESLRSRAHAAAGDEASSQSREQAALERDPADLASRTELAQRLARQGRNAEAAALLEAAPAEQRQLPDLKARIALQRFLAGDLELSRKLAAELVESDPNSAAPRRLLAQIDLAEGRFAAAEQNVRPLAEESETALLDLLRAIEGQGETERAAELLKQRAAAARSENEDETAGAYDLERAKLLARVGEWEAANRTAASISAAAGDELVEQALQLRARCLFQVGRIDEALTLLGPASAERPERALQRLDLLLSAGRAEEAHKVAGLLVDARAERLLAVASIYAGQGDFAHAIPLLERARSADSGSIAAIFRLASSYERVGRTEEAERLFSELLAHAPRYPPALNYLGYLWIERSENLARAVAMVREAVRLDPANAAYVDSLGWGLYKMGEYASAVSFLERAARLEPADATIFEHLGDARVALGDRNGARSAYLRARELSLHPSDELVRKIASLREGS